VIQNPQKWNDEMYAKHPTPYSGLAGWVEKKRLRKIHQLAAIGPGDSVLEVGCEGGQLMASLPECKRLDGVDVSALALEDARERFKKMGREASFQLCDATTGLPFEAGDFDVIICSEVLEHVHEPEKIVRSIQQICTPETRVVLTVPNEIPKLKIKALLVRLKLMDLLFPGIEHGQSEWHIQAFTKSSFSDLIDGDMELQAMHNVLGQHFIAQCRVRP